MDEPGLDILVIDNGSGDGSAEIIRDRVPEVKVIALEDNLGFSAGANLGIQKAMQNNYDLCLLLNNDAFPAQGMLTALLLEFTGEIGLVSPIILYESSPDKIWFGGGEQDRRLLSLKGRGQGEPDGPMWKKSRDVDYLLGTCLLVNLKAASRVGLMDERFFMYYEDLDWSIRFRQNGYRLRLVADARLYHRVAVSSGGHDSPGRHYHLARSSVLFFAKHSDKGHTLLIIFFRLANAIKTVTGFLLTGEFQNIRATTRGLWDGLKLLKRERQMESLP